MWVYIIYLYTQFKLNDRLTVEDPSYRVALLLESKYFNCYCKIILELRKFTKKSKENKWINTRIR